MKIEKLMMGPILANGYILYQKDGGACWVIDPGYSPKEYTSFIEAHDLTPKGILATHYHADHMGAADHLRDLLDCPVYMHRSDADFYRGAVDEFLEEGQALSLDGEEMKVLWTPGHTHGSVCFAAEKSRVCFTGDTLFDTDLGRTDLVSGSEEEMKHSIKDVLNQLDNSWHIYPGHEGDCGMKRVRENNLEFNLLCEGKERPTIW